MGGDVTAYVQPPFAAILLGVGEGIVEGTVVEMVLQFVGEVGVLGRLVLWSPGEAVVCLPFALESLAVAAACPKLRLLEEDGIDAGIDDWLDVPLFEVGEIVLRGHDVGDEVTVHDGVAVHGLLSLVHVPLPVPLPREVVLVFTPGDAGHEVGGVASVAPRL